ncbi:MAG: DUF1573 domain-containing protein [Flavobacteriales bacterium]|jgi:hypothetical protein|nr:MAG: DUF1573 domain-containing protein [Flavobacteriales bacterium]
MKKIFAILFAGFLAVPAFAQSKGPEITFETTTIDYGQIDEKADGARTFVFRNTGNEPLIIERAQPTCGCTVPDWPREPIMPGKEGKIQVTYDTKRIGHFNKSIKIYSNASNTDAQGITTLRIRGEIQRIPDTPTTPLNNSGEQSSIRNK